MAGTKKLDATAPGVPTHQSCAKGAGWSRLVGWSERPYPTPSSRPTITAIAESKYGRLARARDRANEIL